MSKVKFDKPVLVMDCALVECIAGVLPPKGEIKWIGAKTDREQSAQLMPYVEWAMKEVGIPYSALGLIVTPTGPGSFTGIRIAMSAARAMGLALNIPVQGVDTFSAFARTAHYSGDQPMLVVLESKRADFYVQSFAPGFVKDAEPACMMAPDILEMAKKKGDYVLCLDSSSRLIQEVPEIRGHIKGLQGRASIHPEILAREGISLFLKNGGKAETPEPFYMRGADVSMSTKPQREIDRSAQ